MDGFQNPPTLEDALAILAESGDSTLPVAGGTDLMLRLRAGRVSPGALVSVRRLRGLPEGPIVQESDEIVLDAMAPLADLLAHPDLDEVAPRFGAAIGSIGSPAIRNSATLAGNLVNASPAADSVPWLLVMDALVELERAGGTRRLPLADFLLGPGRSARRPDELLTRVRWQHDDWPGLAAFGVRKFGKRRANIIASATLATRVIVFEGLIHDARIAVGGVGPRAVRLSAVEALLEGQPAQGLFARLEPDLVAAVDATISPLSDVRGAAAYKRALVLHAVQGLCEQAEQAARQPKDANA